LARAGPTTVATVERYDPTQERQAGRVPRIRRIGPYRFYFFSNERDEPVHVHVQREAKLAKFWLHPVALAASSGFGSRELRRIEKLIVAHREEFIEAWNEYFGR